MSDTKIALIGHRGVGKTELLQRLRLYFPQFLYFDLDSEIAKTLSNPIYKIFETFGEEYFRSKEIELAHQLLNGKNVVVSLGAGFQLENLPEDVLCIWVQRVTDADGRIFLNRPKLDPNLTSLDDYLSRFEKRNRKYFDCAHFIYQMPEGIQILDLKVVSKNGLLEQEKNLFKEVLFRTSKKKPGVLTLNQKNIQSKIIFDTIELRNDFFSAKDIVQWVGSFRKKTKIILSFRKDSQHDLDELADTISDVDWVDVDSSMRSTLDRLKTEFLTPTTRKIIISCHDDAAAEAIDTLNNLALECPKAMLKCSPIVKTFSELKLIYGWYAKDPNCRLIFPRSTNGDWQWFRCFMLSKQLLNFINDGFSKVADQPSLLDSFLFADTFAHFGAVIGNPIYHSYSPVFHYEYMKLRGWPYFKIKIEEREFDQAMDFLEELGLKFASITSPFKESVYRKYQDRMVNCTPLKSVNTLRFEGNRGVHASNTDSLGILKTLTFLSDEVFKKPITDLVTVLWGGGGVVGAIKHQVPNLISVASRDGRLPQGIQCIDILIWAAPRSLLTKIPENCTIKVIFDLSYGSHSMGLELAKQKDIPYFSGLEMFKEQGLGQQIFWSQVDER